MATKQPELKIRYKKLGDLRAYKTNSRTHSEAQIDQIANSIEEFGFTNPILIHDGEIIAGHGRLAAARLAGLPEVPTIELSHLNETQIKALVIADNQLALNAGWDLELLKGELGDLKAAEFDLDILGFDDKFLDGLLETVPTEGLTDEDSVPEPPEDPITVLGDLWILGKHRLLCGDSTSIDAVEKLMDGQKADFCFTSPPYNGNTSADRSSQKMKNLYLDESMDNKTHDEYVQFNTDIISTMSAISGDNFTCCYNINYNKNSPSSYIDVVYKAKQILPLVETVVWEKQMAISLQGDNLTRIFEFIFILCKGNFKINKNRTDCLKNLWKISNIGANHKEHKEHKEHKACFPVALVEEGIKNFCPHGGVIIEPFGGSGTTMIAADKLGCKSMLMELDPRYCDVIIRRWEEYTDKSAVHLESGKTYRELKEERDANSK